MKTIQKDIEVLADSFIVDSCGVCQSIAVHKISCLTSQKDKQGIKFIRIDNSGFINIFL